MAKDLSKKVSKKNHLWLKWKSLSHEGNGRIILKKPYFYGPVLEDCEPLETSGKMKLDLTPHFLLILPKPYFVELSWDKLLNQNTSKAEFNQMELHDQGLGKLSLLKNSDKIFIDCTDQSTEAQERGVFKMAFEIVVFNEFDEPYDLTK
jgi:hypothetical protein